MSRIVASLALGLVLLAAPRASASTILLNQPGNAGGVWASQNDTTFGNFATVYDDFTFATASIVTGVGWEGQYFNPGTQAPITSFSVTFWSDVAGAPGAALLTDVIAGNAGETFIGAGAFGPAYSYSASLPALFHAAAGTTYWVSIVPDLTFPPQWAWNFSTTPGVSVQDFFGARAFHENNQALTLVGDPVPEPTTLVLLGSGLALAASRRRTRRAA